MRLATIAERIAHVRERVQGAAERAGRSPADVTIVAVSKSVTPQAIEEAATAGIAHLGESRVQEAAAKIPGLRELSVTWHLVGHLQTNKAKTALELFDIIHSVDSLHLAEVLSQRAQRPLPVFLEVNVTGEASKLGFPPEDVAAAAQAVARLPRLDLRGLMTVAPWTRDPEAVRPVFRQLRRLRDAISLRELSIGMSDDFEVAIEEGATLVRIGRAIFGERTP